MRNSEVNQAIIQEQRPRRVPTLLGVLLLSGGVLIGATTAAFVDSEYGKLGGNSGITSPYFNAQIATKDAAGAWSWKDTCIEKQRGVQPAECDPKDNELAAPVSFPLDLTEGNTTKLLVANDFSVTSDFALRMDPKNNVTGSGTLSLTPETTDANAKLYDWLRFTVKVDGKDVATNKKLAEISGVEIGKNSPKDTTWEVQIVTTLADDTSKSVQLNNLSVEVLATWTAMADS
jgi:hypothetical protein